MKGTRMLHLLLLAALSLVGCKPPLPKTVVDPPTKPDVAAIKHVVEVVMSERGFTLDHTQRSPLAVAPLRVDVPPVTVETSPLQVAVSGLKWRVSESSATPAKEGRFSKNHCLYFSMKPDQCPPCKWIKEELFPRFKTEAKDWKIGRGDTDHIRLIDVEDDEEEVEEFLKMPGAPKRKDVAVPLFAVVSGGEVVRMHVGRDRPGGGGYITVAWLTKWIVGSPKSGEAASTAPAGDPSAPTPMAEVDRVLALLPRPQVAFVDFGCGDGRWLIAAAEKWGCRAFGIEIDPARAAAARERVIAAGVSHLVTILTGDATTASVEADVGVAYLPFDVLQRLLPRLQQLTAFASYIHQPPGLPVVQNGSSWIYRRQTQQQRSGGVVWGGQVYTAPVCNSPGCAMCNSIRAGLFGR